MNSRKHFLKGGAACIALPALEAFGVNSQADDSKPKNFVAVGSYLGWHREAFFPKKTGLQYKTPDTLKPIEAFRNDFTVFSGLDHRAGGGHNNWYNFLCGQQPKQYSLDQMIADQLGGKTRFASIETTSGTGEGAKSMSYTKEGTGLPMISRPSVLYKKLFPSKDDRARTEYLLQSGRSALDEVRADALKLQKSLPGSDSQKLEEYFTSLRSVEKRMGQQLSRINDPIPQPDYKMPDYDPMTPNLQMESSSLFLDLIALALETNSTRVASLFLDGLGQVFSINGKALGAGYHGLSHHGNNATMIKDLVTIESAHFHCIAGFIKQLKEKKSVTGKSLLDDTILLVGTGMGNANSHDNRNLPTLVCGGGFKHKGHLAFDPKGDSVLLGSLYLTLMHKLGMPIEQFSNASTHIDERLA